MSLFRTLFERVHRLAAPIYTGGLLLTLQVSLHEGFWLKIARRGVRSGFLTEAAQVRTLGKKWILLCGGIGFRAGRVNEILVV